MVRGGDQAARGAPESGSVLTCLKRQSGPALAGCGTRDVSRPRFEPPDPEGIKPPTPAGWCIVRDAPGSPILTVAAIRPTRRIGKNCESGLRARFRFRVAERNLGGAYAATGSTLTHSHRSKGEGSRRQPAPSTSRCADSRMGSRVGRDAPRDPDSFIAGDGRALGAADRLGGCATRLSAGFVR
jgi:hypothetical protein